MPATASFEFVDLKINKNCMVLVHKLPVTLNELERELKNIPYLGQRKIKDPFVENGKIPQINKVFYQYLFYFGLPTPEELIQAYFKKHKLHETKTHIKFKGDNRYYSKEGVVGRIYRTYPSLIRDLHFYLLCQESNRFDDVSYSLQDDMNGIDLKITYKGQEFAVALFVSTQRSKMYKELKYNRHEELSIPEICIEMGLSKEKNFVGDYALYQKTHLNYLTAKMEECLSNPILKVY